MQRRTVIKDFIYVAGGLAILPSCLHQEQGSSIPLKNLKMSSNQEKLLAEVVATLIPTTDIPGAKDLGVHQFVMVMLDDCFDKDDQDNFMKGLDGLNELSQKKYDAHFITCTTSQREELLYDIEKMKNVEKVSFFYSQVRRLTIQGYLDSKYVMTNINKYVLVPGRFKGCVPVKQA